MGYLQSILPKNPTGWTFNNSTIDGSGNLIITAGGNASFSMSGLNITVDQFRTSFKVKLAPVAYFPKVYVDVFITGTKEEDMLPVAYSETITIPMTWGTVFYDYWMNTLEHKHEASNVTDLRVVIRSSVDVVLSDYQFSWEANINDDMSNIKNNLEAIRATMVTTEYVETFYLTANQIATTYLSAADATLKYLTSANAMITYATIVDLDAATAEVNQLSANYAQISSLINGHLTSANIQSLNLTALNTTIENGMIKNAMIDNLSADKLTAGNINTTKVKITSESGQLHIEDNTILISDATIPRVQIGKDANTDYNIYIWDAAGNLMFDATGITAHAIQSSIIRNDMVSETANISATKLDINSLFTAMNDDGMHTIKSSKILMDDSAQTLNVVFQNMTEKINLADSKATNAITDVGIANGKLNVLASQTQIDELVASGVTLYDRYASVQIDLDSITSTVTNVQTQLGEVAANTIGLYTLRVISNNGLVFAADSVDITLEAQLIKGNTDVTRTYHPGAFRWKRTSVNKEADALWNAEHHTGYTLTLTSNNIEKTTSYACEAILAQEAYAQANDNAYIVTNDLNRIILLV